MKIAGKLTKIFSLIFLAVSLSFLTSCGEGCTGADEFDTASAVVESYPEVDGVDGTYDPVSGGQRAEWHDTGLVSNGSQLVIKVAGSWTPWYGNESGMNSTSLENLGICKSCAHKSGVDNCLCYGDQVPEAEEGIGGGPVTNTDGSAMDCTDPLNQEDPAKCTCVQGKGLVTDYGIYHTNLNYYDKYGEIRKPDDQEPCRYKKGMGAYIGLFGRNGVTVPTRVYHLYSEEETCDISLTSDVDGDGVDDCVEPLGDGYKDVTKYIFRSANGTTLVQDDNAGNDGTDTNPSDDVYHSPNQVIKVIMYDSYYKDNYGKYNLTFYGGTGVAKDPGLLEFLVNIIDNAVSGEVGDDGERHGGIIEFMYKAIVQDSGAIVVFQISLALYIMVYGFGILFGLAEISQKELMARVLKISLIIFFTSADSWYFYNEIVVGFFKDGMDYLVSFLVSLNDSGYDLRSAQTLQISSDYADAHNTVTYASRFAYIDTMIKKMLSTGTAKKLLGLFFQSFFGWLYILIIYALIFGFIFVMLEATAIYVVNLMKIVFVLALGPVFMVFTLFKQTEGIFQKWIAFLGSRSLEIVLMFFILYNFVMIIDQEFTSLLYFEVCTKVWNLWFFSINTLESDVDRSLIVWLGSFIKIAGLIYVTHLMIDKIPSVTAGLISIKASSGQSSGIGSGGSGGMASSLNMALGAKDKDGNRQGGMMGAVKYGMGKAGSGVGFGSGALAQGATLASRAAMNSKVGKAISNSAVGKAASSIKNKIPFSGPVKTARNMMYKGELDAAKQEAAKKGLTGKAADTFARKAFMDKIHTKMHRAPNKGNKKIHDPNGMKRLGVNTTSALAYLDKKMVQDPLKAKHLEIADSMKNRPPEEILLGKDAINETEKQLKSWAEENLSGGAASISGHLSDMKDSIRDNAELTTSEARKKFAGNEELEDKYLQHLKTSEYDRKQKMDDLADKDKKSLFGMNVAGQKVRDMSNTFSTDANKNPERARKSFARKKDNAQKRENFETSDLKNLASSKDARRKVMGAALGDHVNVIGEAMNNNSINQMTRDADTKALKNRLSNPDLDEKERKFFTDQLRDNMYADGLREDSAGPKLSEEERIKGINDEAEKLAKEWEEAKDISAKEAIAKRLEDIENTEGPLLQECDLGLNSSNLGLNTQDPGLKPSNLGLGVEGDQSNNQTYQDQVTALKGKQGMAQMMTKMSKMNLKVAEFELENLKNKPNRNEKDDQRITDLEGKVDKYTEDTRKAESTASEIASQISQTENLMK